MSLSSALARGQAAAESRMTDACSARRQTGTTYDDSTGDTIPAWTALHSGPCRLTQPKAAAGRTSAGEADVLLQSPELHLPMSAPPFRPGDEVTLTASAYDPASIGRVFIVRAVPGHTQSTARRYGVIERTS